MLFDLISIAKVVTIFEYPNNFLLFIENLCFCSLKIAVCVPKITIISKNCRLKITIISKNYRLKITAISKNYGIKIIVRVSVYARTRVKVRKTGHATTTGTPTEHTTTGKERNAGNTGKPVYIGIIAGNEKKV